MRIELKIIVKFYCAILAYIFYCFIIFFTKKINERYLIISFSLILNIHISTYIIFHR
ncbi:hypothetical protein L861_02550 [Litchfieldella anticariensis FP35 = DSM 16096]|uniref:Uncharacterized protein n=1 Tax=Litchfieldella anticariensis (strain DSM 16096 / CECT 5854 / CIP 108499 / LMG 22089 / FP35) TaxID=1121939 RepID=S2KUF6_LITA3|nr:hypothetical protein L861_02550 [Halomonas anticariensis FP35 = DSM 16096]